PMLREAWVPRKHPTSRPPHSCRYRNPSCRVVSVRALVDGDGRRAVGDFERKDTIRVCPQGGARNEAMPAVTPHTFTPDAGIVVPSFTCPAFPEPTKQAVDH